MDGNRNHDFRNAKAGKKDEFYTQLNDIELELTHYKGHFENKTVYLNCDDPRDSNFYRYFSVNFKSLGLKKLITSCYKSIDTSFFTNHISSQAVWFEYEGKEDAPFQHEEKIGVQPLHGDGDFRSEECIALLKQADIVVTNPPFSLFREYFAQLVRFDKEFIILGNMNALTYKEVFPFFQNNQVWYGPSIRSGDREFSVPDDYPLTAAGYRIDRNGSKFIRVKGVRWFTNLEYQGRHKNLHLTKKYRPDNYPKYVNYNAIEVSKTLEIPIDYDDLMGVPITFADKYNPYQFEIIGSSKTLGIPMSRIAKKGTYQQGDPRFYLQDEHGEYHRMYDRIVVRNKQPMREVDASVLQISR